MEEALFISFRMRKNQRSGQRLYYIPLFLFACSTAFVPTPIRAQRPSSNFQPPDRPGIPLDGSTAIWVKGGAHLAVLPPKYRAGFHEDAGLMWKSDAPW